MFINILPQSSNYELPHWSLKLRKWFVVKNTTRKSIGDFVVYHKGLSFVVNATRVGGDEGMEFFFNLRVFIKE